MNRFVNNIIYNVRSFKKFDHKKIWLDSMIGMTWGFMASLVIGTLVGLFAINQNNSFSHMIVNIKNMLFYSTGFSIGIGIGLKRKLPPLKIIGMGIGTWVCSQSLFVPKFSQNSFVFLPHFGINTKLSLPGDVFAAWISGVVWVYIFKIVDWKTHLDVLIVPLFCIVVGIINGIYITYVTTLATKFVEYIIYNSADKSRVLGILLAPLIGTIMGMALSLPISSAAIAFAVGLKGDAATAAIAGTAAQMISFGVLTYLSTRSVQKSIAVGFGTSMLHISNYSRKPIILILPALVSATTALIAAWALPLGFSGPPSPTSGMGTCGLFGQIFTLNINGWDNMHAWLNVILMQLLFPALMTLSIGVILFKKNILRKEWFII